MTATSPRPAGPRSSVLPVWITQPQAAEILGVHPQTVAKMVARGDLTSRGQGVRGSLDRDEVLALGVARREAAERRDASERLESGARRSQPRSRPTMSTCGFVPVRPPISWGSANRRSLSERGKVGCPSSSMRVGGGSDETT